MEQINFLYESNEETLYSYDNYFEYTTNEIDNDDDDYDEDCPCVFYQVPKSKSSSQASIIASQNLFFQEKIEKIREQRALTEKNKQNLDIKKDLPHFNIALRKIKKLTETADDVREVCYVPERDLLILILKDAKTVKFYSTKSFKAVLRKRCPKRINVVRYSPEAEKVVFSGDDYYVEVFSLKTLQSEAISTLVEGWSITELTYVKKRNIIAAGMCPSTVDILSATNLARLSRFEIDSTYSVINDIICLHSDSLMITSRSASDFTPTKKLHVYSLRTKGLLDSPAVNISAASYAGVTMKSPLNIVTCLGKIEGEVPKVQGGFRLIQLVMNSKNKSLTLHKVGPQDMEFEELNRIQNSDYFIVRTAEFTGSRTLLLKVNGDKAQLMRLFLASDCSIIRNHLFAKLTGSSLIVASDNKGGLCVYSFLKKKDELAVQLDDRNE